MKSISHLFPSKELEHIAWLNIVHYFSFKDTISIIVFSSNEKQIPIITQSYDDISNPNFKDNFIYIFGLRNTFMNRSDIIIAAGSIAQDEYELFKQDKMNCEYKFSDGIELTRNDIPEIYKLLQ
jgi:hypothetical protein